jgi:hypothetical protein
MTRTKLAVLPPYVPFTLNPLTASHPLNRRDQTPKSNHVRNYKTHHSHGIFGSPAPNPNSHILLSFLLKRTLCRIQELRLQHIQPGLFFNFSCCALLKRLAEIKMSAGKTPGSFLRELVYHVEMRERLEIFKNKYRGEPG